MMGESSDEYDAIVIGVGGMGSAAVYHLAKRGKDVLGLEQFGIPHRKGSSHGNTRIVRLAYYEDPAYVPLQRRAYELWRDLQDEHGEKLLHVTGSLDAGPEDSEVFRGALRACEEHSLEHEVLTGSEVNERFSGFDLPSEFEAVYQPDGGFVPPERCIVAHVKQAQRRGAEVRAHETVQSWEPLPNGVRVQTDKGTYRAGKLVVTAGGWTYKLIDELVGEAVPERITVGWFQPDVPDDFLPEQFPVFHVEGTDERYYGLPIHTALGFKIGHYPRNRAVDPDEMERSVTRRDEARLRRGAERYFSGVGPTMNIDTCLVTVTPDENFVLDHHPDYPQVVVVAGFSGRGFKFASAVGEILSDLAVSGETPHDIAKFSMERLAGDQ